MSTNQQTPYGVSAMQDVTDEMVASKLTCVNGTNAKDGFLMDDIKARAMTSDSHDSLESLA